MGGMSCHCTGPMAEELVCLVAMHVEDLKIEILFLQEVSESAAQIFACELEHLGY